MKFLSFYHGLLKLITLLMLMFAAAGCSLEKSEDQPLTFKVLYSSAAEFYADYGEVLAAKFTNITFEVVEFQPIVGALYWNAMSYGPATESGWHAEQLVSLIKEQNPDLLFFPPVLAQTLLEQDMLLDLTDQLPATEFEHIDPALKEYFIAAGHEKLYFLSDTYAPQVMMYNKQLLEQYNFEMASTIAHWEKLADASTIISAQSDNQSYGFSSMYYSFAELLFNIGEDLGLSWYDSAHHEVLFESEEWLKVLDMIVPLTKTFWNEQSDQQLFADGNLAVLLTDYNTADQLSKEKLDFEWNIAAPVLSIDDHSSRYMSFKYFNGVNRSAEQVEAAIQVWQYLNSEQLAKQHYMASFDKTTLPIYPQLVTHDQLNIAELYNIASAPTSRTEQVLSEETMKAIENYINNQFLLISEGELELQQALPAWEDELLLIIAQQSP